jgi:hypothetical protein
VSIKCESTTGVECKDIVTPSNTADCFVDIIYTYELTNVGDVNMDITVADRSRGGVTVSFLDLLPVKALVPGESASAKETETINACVEGTFVTTVNVAADPPSGVPCFATDTYEFNTITAPTPAPTPPPTPAPTPPPTPSPTPPPTQTPTPPPTPSPTPPPTQTPTPPPTPSPTPPPTPEPTLPPSPAPVCLVNVSEACGSKEHATFIGLDFVCQKPFKYH